jgi:hypothetical protein
MNSVARLTLLFACAFSITVASDPLKTRMTKEEAIAAGIKAIEARFPGATKKWSFDATFQDGIWGIGGIFPNRPAGLCGGGMPIAEIRDKDGASLNVYFAR